MHEIVIEKIADFMSEDIPLAFERDLSLGKIQAPKKGNIVNVVVGMRRCGKTYRMYQEMHRIMEQGWHRERILYFNFEDERLKPYATELLADVVETYYAMYPEAQAEGSFLFFDEIQEVPDWGMFLRRLVDTQKATIYVTGSSSKMLSSEVATEFRGRALNRELYPMSFSEYARFHYPFIEEEADQSELRAYANRALPGSVKAWLREAFSDYLRQGGFIATQDLSRPDAVLLLQDYANMAVNDDVIDRYDLSNPLAARSFLARCISSSARELSINKTYGEFRSRGLNASRETLSLLLKYYKEAYIVYAIKDFARTLSDNPKSVSKVYAVDPALFQAFSPAAAQDVGQCLETAVFMQLQRNHNRVRNGSIARMKVEVGSKQREVDFVVGDPLLGEAQQLIQVSVSLADKSTRKREVSALQVAMAKFRMSEAWIITMNEESEVVIPEGVVHVIPAWKWFFELPAN